jgi:hypothetical protein
MPRYRPAAGFLLDTPIKRKTPKSAFLKRLERDQKIAANRERDRQTVWFSDPRKVVPFRKA